MDFQGSPAPQQGTSVTANSVPKLTITDYVGFDNITKQIQRRLLKTGFTFNLMLVGRSGLGKTTFLNTLFSTRVLEPVVERNEVGKTTEIISVTSYLEENGVTLKLTVVDTPGFGEQLNNEDCFVPIVKYIKEQYSSYLRKELTPSRDMEIQDTRIHAMLYFIMPSGHSLSMLDIVFMKKVCDIVNLIPVIAKADILTLEERANFKRRIREEMEFHNINYYPYPDMEKVIFDGDQGPASIVTSQARYSVPFAIIGSERNVVVNGKAVRGRRTRWGIIDIENPEHCEFILMRNFLIRSHLDQLIECTRAHYEDYRRRQLIALRESTKSGSNPKPQANSGTPSSPEMPAQQNQQQFNTSSQQQLTPSPVS